MYVSKEIGCGDKYKSSICNSQQSSSRHDIADRQAIKKTGLPISDNQSQLAIFIILTFHESTKVVSRLPRKEPYKRNIPWAYV